MASPRTPPAGPSRITTYPGRHVITEPVGDFDIVDERYAFLRTAPDIVPLAAHEYQGRVHPLLWARERGPVPDRDRPART